MEEKEDVVYIKIFDKEEVVVFEGKVSTNIEPHELVKLRCFWERDLYGVYSKATNEQVTSFKGLQNNVELVAGGGDFEYFSGVLYVGAEDGVLRKSKRVPSCECKMMSLWNLSHEECEKAFKCETLEELEMYYCKLRQIPHDIGKTKNLKKLRLDGLYELKSIPEEIGELSKLEELCMECGGAVWRGGVESLPKRLKDLKMLKSISLFEMPKLQLNAEDLVAFLKLKCLKILYCNKAFTPSFTQAFWEMIKSTTYLHVLDLTWYMHDQEMVITALEENGSIVDGGYSAESYRYIFERNKENHKRVTECVVHLSAIRRCRNFFNHVPREDFFMLSLSLWNTKCDIKSWT
jgi:hypothetical protein